MHKIVWVGPSNFPLDAAMLDMPTLAAMDVSQIISRAGGPTKLARALGMDHSSVLSWRKTGRIPAERVLAIEAATDIPRHELRPDIYPAPSSQAAA